MNTTEGVPMKPAANLFLDLAADGAESEDQRSLSRRTLAFIAAAVLMISVPLMWAANDQRADATPVKQTAVASDDDDDDESGSGDDDDEETGVETMGNTDVGGQDTGKSTQGETDGPDGTGQTEATEGTGAETQGNTDQGVSMTGAQTNGETDGQDGTGQTETS
jgi:hypothetical protein